MSLANAFRWGHVSRNLEKFALVNSNERQALSVSPATYADELC